MVVYPHVVFPRNPRLEKLEKSGLFLDSSSALTSLIAYDLLRRETIEEGSGSRMTFTYNGKFAVVGECFEEGKTYVFGAEPHSIKIPIVDYKKYLSRHLKDPDGLHHFDPNTEKKITNLEIAMRLIRNV